MKKVSVIIPFYSRLDWLFEAIESVLGQTYTNIEIIVVNDGSEEDLSSFLQRYGNRIIYIEQPNSGPATARNTGIRRATGEYIAFQDSDDIWLPTKLEKQIAFMEKTDTVWNHCGFYYWNPDTDKLKEVDVSRDYDDIFAQRMVTTQIATPSVVIKREVFSDDRFYFPEGVRNGEDDQLYTLLAKNYPISLVEEPLLKVRLRGSNSNGKAIERFHLRVANLKKWQKMEYEIPFGVKVIYSFYRIYSRLFPNVQSSKIKDLLAKALWSIPYGIERMYVRYLAKISHKNPELILKKL